MRNSPAISNQKTITLYSLLSGYRAWIMVIVLLVAASSGLGLLIPQQIALAIDAYEPGRFDLAATFLRLAALALGSTFLGFLLIGVQAIVSENFARELRYLLIGKFFQQSYDEINSITSEMLLTYFTSDVDAIKAFISQAIATIIASVFIMISVSAILLWLNWLLALLVLAVMPLIAIAFAIIMRKAQQLFARFMTVIDRINLVLNENIVGAAIIRLVDSSDLERSRFAAASGKAREIAMEIVRHFAVLLPIVGFLSNLATLAVLGFGGRLAIAGDLSLGVFYAFNSYLGMLFFAVTVMGSAFAVIGQTRASFGRIEGLLNAPAPAVPDRQCQPLSGEVEVAELMLVRGEKTIFERISFVVEDGSRTAIVGPTAAGKSQLLHAMLGLLPTCAGTVLHGDQPVHALSPEILRNHTGIVFQGSKLFNMSLRENIALGAEISETNLARAIETAALTELVARLPDGLDTMLAERGASLSGGQRQRIMLARALARNPRVLFLDDFTARVDLATEARIRDRLIRNYPHLTLVSITQKIPRPGEFDQVILMMQGELIAKGTHEELLQTCPEYAQVLLAQQTVDNQA